MTRRSKRSENNSSNYYTTSATYVEEFQLLFKELFLDVKYETVNPHTCIPFVKIRGTSESGVQRLNSLFDQNGEQTNGVHWTGVRVRYTNHGKAGCRSEQ